MKCGSCGDREAVWHYDASIGDILKFCKPSRNGKKYEVMTPELRHLCDDCVPRGCECPSCIESCPTNDEVEPEWGWVGDCSESGV